MEDRANAAAVVFHWYQREIAETNVKLGWRGSGQPEATFLEAMMLLVSEVSEAVEAWRKRGLQGWNMRVLNPQEPCEYCRSNQPGLPECPDHPDKPEGVGSEFADIFIRLMDDCDMFGIDLAAEVERKLRYNKTREYRHGGKRL